MSNSKRAKPFIPFQFPDAAALGKPDQYGIKQGQKIPKETVYKQSNPINEVKQLFIVQVEHIIWRYKLSSDTLNLAASEQVSEIQIFDIQLKANCDALDTRVLETLDKAIPSNIFYRIFNANERRAQLQCVMAYKRTNKRDTDMMVVQDYFFSEWIAKPELESGLETTRKLPVVVNMAGLYTELLRSLLPIPARDGEGIDEQLSRISQLHHMQGKLTQLQVKLRNEKQFNRKVDLNKTINQLKQQIQSLNGV